MGITDYFKYMGQGMYEGLLGILDTSTDDKARDLFRKGLRTVVSGKKLSKARMHRLALLLAEAASAVAEELK